MGGENLIGCVLSHLKFTMAGKYGNVPKSSVGVAIINMGAKLRSGREGDL